MQSAERDILAFLSSVSMGFNVLITIAVLALGLVIVRPLNKAAGLIFAGAAGARLVGFGLEFLLNALEPKDAGLDTIMIFRAISSLLWVFTASAFYGGVIFGSVKLTQTQTNHQPHRGAW